MSNLAFSFYFLFLVKLQIHSDTSTHSSQAQAYKEFLDICIRFFLLLLVCFFFSVQLQLVTHTELRKLVLGFFRTSFFASVLIAFTTTSPPSVADIRVPLTLFILFASK